MGTFIVILFIGAIAFIIYKIATTSSFKANNDQFEQAGVIVNFNARTITIKGRTFSVDAVQGIKTRIISKFGTEVQIQVDDFNKPIHKIGISGINGAGEKFVQRLSTALRKAGGPSFY